MKIFSLGNEKSPLMCNLSLYEGKKYIDIRNWYIDKKTNEFKPTTKGITLSKSKYFTLMDELFEHAKEINDWFSNQDDTEYVADRTSQENVPINEFAGELIFKTLPKNLMFNVEVIGFKKNLIINSDSLLGKELSYIFKSDRALLADLIQDPKIFVLIKLLISFGTAGNKLDSHDVEVTGENFIADFFLESKRKYENRSE
jgi:hypothetical protein